MEKTFNNPYSSPEEMAKATGLTIKEARGIIKQWNHKRPENPEDMKLYANQASRYEHGMRGLNYDRSKGLITEAEYRQEEQKLKKEIYGD